MRILWFGKSSADDADDADDANDARGVGAVGDRVSAARTPRKARPRSDEDVALALGSLPCYRVVLRLGPADATTAATWARVLAPALGEERAARILTDAMRDGLALVTVGPRELAEWYRDALLVRGLPCAIEPA